MLQRLQDSAFSQWVVGSDSLLSYPTILTLHTVGLALVVGTAVVVNLRAMGVGLAIPLATMRRAFRIFWVGFVINLASGLILFAAEATDKGRQPVFFIKLTLIAIALAMTSMIRRQAFADGGAPAGHRVRALAATSLVLWACAIVAGRLMAYL